MKHFSTLCLCLFLMVVACADGYCASAAKAAKPGPLTPIGAISPTSKDWVEKKLVDGKSVVLTNSYLFQVMKGISQENQKLAEEAILIPLLQQTLTGLIEASSDENTSRLFGVALLLLVDKSEIEFPEQIKKEAQAIKNNPLFTPRGHYTDSEEMQRYFQAMQYLSKATVDVSVKPDAFPFPQEMLYPFETSTKVRELLTKPDNARLLAYWRTIHSFYDSINGPSDLPTFLDICDQFKDTELTKEFVEQRIQQNRMPKINPEMGLGIQPLGERFSLHQAVIDNIKRKLIKEDTPRDEMAKILRFRNLMNGTTAIGEKIEGLSERVRNEKGQSYGATTLRAISLGGKGWPKNPFRLNFFATSLTGLAEQTALMTKTSTVVAKSVEGPRRIKNGINLYFEPDSEKYLIALARSSNVMVKHCSELRQKATGLKVENPTFANPAPAFRTCAALSKLGKPLVTGSLEWKACSKFVTELSRVPAVTVDVFRFKDRSGNTFFYQWGVAPFGVAYRPENIPNRVSGMDMVFFETWADEIVKDSQGPLTNFQWQERVTGGKLNTLPSIIRVPEKEGVIQ
ncbi:MAG: DUF3160 domain-containing protein [Desulfomonilaceae bacterium]